MSRGRITWAVTFGLIFALSLDYWAWGRPVRLGLFGLPLWVYYFFLLQLVLAAALALFARRGRDTERDDPPG